MSSSGSSGNAGPVSYVMARQGAYSSPLTPPRRKERPKVSATGAHDSSSCVLKCSLDKSTGRRRPACAFGFTRACEPGGGVDQRT